MITGTLSGQKTSSSETHIRRDLEHLYRKLSLCLEALDGFYYYIDEPKERACIAILVEDLSALIEEYENLIVAGPAPRCVLSSFESRSQCVMDEVVALLRTATNNVTD